MHRILVALDASPRAEAVLHAAGSLAAKTGAEVIAFRAVGLPAELPPEAFGLPPGDVTELLEGQARAYLERALKALPADVRAHAVARGVRRRQRRGV